MSARYNHALKDEVVNYVSYLLKSNSQKSEMAEEQLRKKYEAEYGRPLREDLQVLHMSMAEVLALARAKDGYQKSNVSELEVENSPIAQKKAVSVVSKAREQQPKAPLQEKMVEKKKSRKRLVETPSLLSDDAIRRQNATLRCRITPLILKTTAIKSLHGQRSINFRQFAALHHHRSIRPPHHHLK
ncbi:hypothetical protein M3Y94_00082200 [Aphelenchoides besseyi]|nr:hypothetical protein M3Y94_00082200 [Aphelenchoides besseyi]